MSEELITRLRGQLQNCVNHLERAKHHWCHGNSEFQAAIDSANKALYQSLYDAGITASDVPESVRREIQAQAIEEWVYGSFHNCSVNAYSGETIHLWMEREAKKLRDLNK